MSALRRRDLLLSLKYATIEGSFSVPMLQLTTGSLPFAIGFAVKGLGWDAPAVGFLAATPFLCFVLQPPVSHVLQRFLSLHEIMRLTFLMNAVPWFFVSLFPFLDRERDLLFVLIVMVSSLGNSLSAVAWSSSMSELVPLGIRGRYFGNRNLIYAAWSLVAALAAGQLADLTDNSLAVFGAIFAVAAVARLIGLYYLTRMKFPQSVTERRPQDASSEAFFATLKDANLVRLLLFNGIFGLCLNLGSPFYSVFVLKELPYTLGDLTILTTVASLGGLVSLTSWGALIDRFGNKPVMVGGAAGWLTSAAVLWLVTGPERHLQTYLNYFIHGFMWAVFQLCQFNLMIKMVPPERKTPAISLYFGAVSLLTAFGPLSGGMLLARLPRRWGNLAGQTLTHYHLVIVGSLVLCLLSLLLLARVREPATGSVREMLRLVRRSAEFNPLLGS